MPSVSTPAHGRASSCHVIYIMWFSYGLNAGSERWTQQADSIIRVAANCPVGVDMPRPCQHRGGRGVADRSRVTLLGAPSSLLCS